MSAADTPLAIDMAMLKRLAEVGRPFFDAQLQAVRAEFSDENAATLCTILLVMQLGSVLLKIPNADRAPDGVAAVWSLMGVPFSIDAKRVQ